MKRQAALLLAFLFLFVLAGCGQTPSQPASDPAGEETVLTDGESPEPENPEASEEAPEAPAEEPDTAVPAGEAVDPQWFSDAAFVGDSISVMLEQYNASTSALGSPTFLCSVSLSQQNAQSYEAGNERLPEYPKGSGQHPKVENAIAAAGAKKIYLMLGMNCIAGGVDRACTDLVTLVGKIQAQSPDTAILIQSVTPMTADSPRADESLNNTTIQAFNDQMKTICQEKGWYFINVAEAVSDENGFLRSDFSGDKAMGIHFNYNGAAAWAEYLLTHVPQALK